MKRDFILHAFLIAGCIGFFDGFFNYVRSIGRRRTSGSFRELYEDNSDKNSETSFDDKSDPDNIYTNGEADDMYADFVYMPW